MKKIAVIAWGSLVWDKRSLRIARKETLLQTREEGKKGYW